MTTEASLKIRVDSSEVKNADRSLDDLAKSGDKADGSSKKLTESTSKLSSAARLAATAFTAMAASYGVREIVQASDAWQSAANQLRLVTNGAADLSKTQTALMKVSNDTRSSFESTANLYTRLTRATSEMGLSQTELLGITDTINKSFAVSGATATEAAAAITQLSQGLAAGALRGDEFNSVSEQAPGIMRAIAESLNMTIGDLRAFAAEGGITSEIVVTALQGAADSIDNEFSKSVRTFGQSMTVAKNNMLEFVGGSDLVSSSSSAAGTAVVFLSENVEVLGSAATAAAVAIGAVATVSLVQFVAQMSLATAAQTAFNIAARANPYVLLAAGVGALSFALIEYVRRQDEATESLKEYVKAGGALGPIAAQMLKDQAARVATLVEEKDETEDAAESIGTYGEKVKIVSNLLDAHVQAQEDYKRAQEKAREETEKNSRSILELIGKLENQQLALQMTGRAQAIFNATTEAYSKNAAPEQIAQIATLTAKNYDLAESSRVTGKASEDAAKQAADSWQKTHDYLSSAFVDIMNNGGNAFDNIAKAFERTVQRMVAEWAASGLMKLFTGGGMSGFSLPSFGGGIGGAVTGAAGSAAGAAATGAGWIGGAISSAGSSVMGALGAVPGWGWALGGAAVAAKLLDSGGTMSSNAGILTQNVGGASGNTFSLGAFDSGAQFTGFARREDQGAAVKVAETFGAYDSVLTAIAKSAGINPNVKASDFVGLNEKGSGSGAFFGSASEEGGGNGTPITKQLDSYVKQWVEIVGRTNGVDPSVINSITSKGNADAMIEFASAQFGKPDGSHANGLDYVPFDGYRAELHRGERVQTASQARNSDESNSQLMAKMDVLIAEIRRTGVSTKKTADLLTRVTRDGDSLLTEVAA